MEREETCNCHGRLKTKVEELEDGADERKESIKDLWRALSKKVDYTLFFVLIGILVGIFGCIFVTGVDIKTELASIRTELVYLKQAYAFPQHTQDRGWSTGWDEPQKKGVPK